MSNREVEFAGHASGQLPLLLSLWPCLDSPGKRLAHSWQTSHGSINRITVQDGSQMLSSLQCVTWAKSHTIITWAVGRPDGDQARMRKRSTAQRHRLRSSVRGTGSAWDRLLCPDSSQSLNTVAEGFFCSLFTTWFSWISSTATCSQR